jgi:hypothetical protein
VDSLFALSFLQPWLWAILTGAKPVENRSWAPPARLLGRRVAFHASRGWDAEALGYIAELVGGNAPAVCREAPRGAIVATAVFRGAVEVAGVEHLTETRRVGTLSDAEITTALASRWSFGPWLWIPSEIRILRESVAAKGALGFWRVPDEIAARVRALEVA